MNNARMLNVLGRNYVNPEGEKARNKQKQPDIP